MYISGFGVLSFRQSERQEMDLHFTKIIAGYKWLDPGYEALPTG